MLIFTQMSRGLVLEKTLHKLVGFLRKPDRSSTSCRESSPDLLPFAPPAELPPKFYATAEAIAKTCMLREILHIKPRVQCRKFQGRSAGMGDIHMR